MTTVAAEEAHHLQSFTIQDLHLLVGAVGDIEELLQLVRRECDVKGSALRAACLPLDVNFLDESAVGVKDLNPVVHAVAHIHRFVVGDANAIDGIELLRPGPS